jgi:hypothetical protein
VTLTCVVNVCAKKNAISRLLCNFIHTRAAVFLDTASSTPLRLFVDEVAGSVGERNRRLRIGCVDVDLTPLIRAGTHTHGHTHGNDNGDGGGDQDEYDNGDDFNFNGITLSSDGSTLTGWYAVDTNGRCAEDVGDGDDDADAHNGGGGGGGGKSPR